MGGRELVRYRSWVYDSARWRHVRLRPGDIVISTPPKCGTTWTHMGGHRDNMDLERFGAARAEAAAVDGDAGLPLPPAGDRPASEQERFWRWVDDDTPPAEAPSSLVRTLRHLETFWAVRAEPGIVLLHYDDLSADLEGEMRGLADRLRIEVAEDLWPEAGGGGRLRRHEAPSGGAGAQQRRAQLLARPRAVLPARHQRPVAGAARRRGPRSLPPPRERPGRSRPGPVGPRPGRPLELAL
jgi:hypothetical protein